jgi:hypothetical protein
MPKAGAAVKTPAKSDHIIATAGRHSLAHVPAGRDRRHQAERPPAEARGSRGRGVPVGTVTRTAPMARPLALERWRREIRLGTRRNDIASFDDLAAAAANESAGLEAESLGRRGEAGWYYDRALLRLHGCYHDPDDGTTKEPGPGRLCLAELRAHDRVAKRQRKQTWLERNAARAAEYVA